MQPKDIIYDREQACSDIGQALHDAKRRMLDSFKKGVPLNVAAETFTAEASNVITRVQAKLDTLPAQDTKDANEIETENDKSARFDEDERLKRFAEIERMARASVFTQSSKLIDHQQALVTLLNALSSVPDNEREELCAIARDQVFCAVPALREQAISFIVENRTPAEHGPSEDDLTSDCDPVHVPVTGTLDGSGIHSKSDRLEMGPDAQPEMQRLVKAILGYGDRAQEMALLQLLTHLLPHDASGWVMFARNAVIAESTDLIDEAAELLIKNEPRLHNDERNLKHAIKSVMDQTDEAESDAENAPVTDDESEIGGYRLLSADEKDYILTSIADDASGSFYIGMIVILLEHLVAYHLKGDARGRSFEGEVMKLGNKLVSENCSSSEKARKYLRDNTYIKVGRRIKELAAEGGEV